MASHRKYHSMCLSVKVKYFLQKKCVIEGGCLFFLINTAHVLLKFLALNIFINAVGLQISFQQSRTSDLQEFSLIPNLTFMPCLSYFLGTAECLICNICMAAKIMPKVI